MEENGWIVKYIQNTGGKREGFVKQGSGVTGVKPFLCVWGSWEGGRGPVLCSRELPGLERIFFTGVLPGDRQEWGPARVIFHICKAFVGLYSVYNKPLHFFRKGGVNFLACHMGVQL